MCLCRGTLHWKGTLLQGWGHHLLRDTLLQGDSIAGDTLLQRHSSGVGAQLCTPELLHGAEMETGQPSLRKSPAGEKSRERETKIAPFQ